MNSINLTRIDDGEAVSEYYKQLRTNIYFCGQDKQCIAFTSSFPNEGKSTVVFFAKHWQRTVNVSSFLTRI